MAERLSNSPETVELLDDHQIGYHSSGHSIHPTLFEFTDVESYEEAYQTSLIRERAHIDPLTGLMEGPGGIHALQALFPRKQIVAYRAPGYCWSPPHLDALKTFGISFDFSTNMSVAAIRHRGITFYPFPILLANWQGGTREHFYLQRVTLKREISVLTIHPSTMVNRLDWDLIYYPKCNNLKVNPTNLTGSPERTPSQIASIYNRFDLLLTHLGTLQKLNFLTITPELKTTNKSLCPTVPDVDRYYEMSIKWAKGFGYKPKFLHNHFTRFFNTNSLNEQKDNKNLPE